MPSDALTSAAVLAILATTPSRLATATTGLTLAQLQTSPAADEWSVSDILAHLRACADVWGGCIAAILADDTPTLRAVNPSTWITRTHYRTLAFEPSLRAFTEKRTTLLTTLDALPAEGWARVAIVTGGGSPRATSVRDYGERMARHERAHVHHIQRLAHTLRA